MLLSLWLMALHVCGTVPAETNVIMNAYAITDVTADNDRVR
jgi:hypothetical protein